MLTSLWGCWRTRILAGRWRVRDEKGAASAEYALLLALVVIILIGSLTALGNVLNQKLQAIIDQLTQAGQ